MSDHVYAASLRLSSLSFPELPPDVEVTEAPNESDSKEGGSC